ncbi:nuclear transport factor 2 family protein [Jannaschia sp. R86511]|uniref:nuclear transport factor 2 family protein n=1 Tax=Jannaschia sp. R86511 TaxID=3093853 RepID=UPI0036D352AA
MEPGEVATQLWERVARRDWTAFGELLHDDVVLEYPVTGEVFHGRANVVAINAEYSDGWSIHLLRVIADGDTAVSEVEVPLEGVGIFRVASFWTVRSGRVLRAREYWTSLGGDEPPAWRLPYRARA